MIALTNSGAYHAVPSNNGGDSPEVWWTDSQQDYHPSPINSDFAESHSLANSSGALSTSSEIYDENAENIDPNSRERKDQQTHHVSVFSGTANVLCDSTSSIAHQPLPQHDRAPDDAEPIAAPVPLPYSARSKEVLSAMISPVQPSGFPKPGIEESHIYDNSIAYAQSAAYPQPAYILPVRLISLLFVSLVMYKYAQASETVTNFSSNAPHGPQYNNNLSREVVQYTDAFPAPRKQIRPVSPATLIALTEPFLMAWIHDYPPLRPLPSPFFPNAEPR
ncbi:hypothetical protein MVEN_00597500 [Mycena venus]|uniref:Uncharacterized protein n=1 Tax=Mycena venus TaxID=2733690 RepID=A0A8H6YM66_9AGAR|nr:hypothetical protein MVEN_00597500 [Mycena venus]